MMYINYHVKIYVLLNFLIFYLEFLERENLFPLERKLYSSITNYIIYIRSFKIEKQKNSLFNIGTERILSIRARKNVFDKGKIRINCVVWMWVVPMPRFKKRKTNKNGNSDRVQCDIRFAHKIYDSHFYAIYKLK